MALLGGSTTCPRCSASFASGVLRCPFCGANVDAAAAAPKDGPSLPRDLPSLPTPRPSTRQRPPIEPTKKGSPWVVPLAACGILLTGVTAIWLLGRDPAPTTAPPAHSGAVVAAVLSASPAPRPESALFADPSRVDASDLFPKVKQRALVWNADARIVSITASPVVGDKVDLTQQGAEIVYVFGTDMSARSQPQAQLAITVRRSGMEQAPATEAPKPAAAKAGPASTRPSIGVGEPNCVFDAAAKAAHASGVPAATVMKLRYESDPRLRRGVWTARVAGRSELERVIDGQTCAVVVRQAPPAKPK